VSHLEGFRDDDSVDVAILSGAGDAFSAGADLRTYVPANYVEATPSRVREIVNPYWVGSPEDCIGSGSR